MGKIVIPLAEGCEELEAVTNIDVLRRAGLKVVTVSLGNLEVTGDHEQILKADQNIDQLKLEEVEGIVLPGGMPGAANLRDDQRVIELVQQIDQQDGLLAAVCAAPIVLEAAGVLEDRPATSYPGFAQQLSSCHYQQERVVVDENLITARGPGVALEFALTIVKRLVTAEQAKELKAAMLTNF